MFRFGLNILFSLSIFVSAQVFSEKDLQLPDTQKSPVDVKENSEESVFSRVGRWFEEGVNGFFSSDEDSVNNDSKPATKQQSASELQQDAKNSPYEAIVSVLEQKGAAECAEKAKKLAGFVGATEPNASAVIYFDENASGQEMISAVVSSEEISGPHLAVMDISQGKKCTATYEVLKIWVEACPQVVSAVYANYRFKTRLSPSVVLFQATDNLHLFTMPLPGGAGCLTLQKELT